MGIVYVESCEPIRGHEECTWLIDSRVSMGSATSVSSPPTTAHDDEVLRDRD